ncbi:MAG TPA: hypothetical protein VG965_00620 [Patescibacteria group bacterium]|nr:hypothetical protein [Patescibacteria group bacterium]
MKAIDLKKNLKGYKKGWVAIDTRKKNKVVAHSDSLEEISKKIDGMKNILLIPASDNYFGFITSVNE